MNRNNSCVLISAQVFIFYMFRPLCVASVLGLIILAEEHAENPQVSRFVQYVIGEYQKTQATPNTFFLMLYIM